MRKLNISRVALLGIGIFLGSLLGQCHPLKLSVSDVEYKGKILTVNMKLFYDDLEVELTNYYKKEVKIYNEELTGERLKLIENYLSKHFQLKINGTLVSLTLKKASMQGDQVTIEFEKPYTLPSKIDRVLVENSILFNSIPEQRNIVNIKLYADKSAESLLFENENETTVKELTY